MNGVGRLLWNAPTDGTALGARKSRSEKLKYAGGVMGLKCTKLHNTGAEGDFIAANAGINVFEKGA